MSGGMQGGGGVPETLLDTKGQIHGYSTENIAVDVGTNDFSIYAASSAASGLAYGATAKSLLDATGKMLYASAANTLAAVSPGAQNTVLTMGAASVPGWSAPAGGGAWTELYNSGVTTSTGTLESGEFDDKKNLHFMCHTGNATVADNLAVRFNATRSGNTDNQYAWNGFYNGASSVNTSSGRDAIQFLIAGSSGTFFVGCNGYIFNTEDNEKVVMWISTENKDPDSSHYPLDSYWVGKWSNETDFVNEIQITDDGGALTDAKVGSQLVIWGAD